MEEVHGCLVKVMGEIRTVKGDGADIDALIGANPSAEGDDEGGADGEDVRQVNVIAESFRLQETGFDKASYKTYIKGYLKSLKTFLEGKNPERVAPFMEAAKTALPELLKMVDDAQFFVGEEMNPEGMTVLMTYAEDNVTPVFWYWKDGLVEEKV
eukprot:TRINITY_DN1909_c1_g1_i1.p2 TRINITY_DN1909_c1_g1~~TRINITY_DN1909_c1_g1_i1.p2  ORF type:complete len:180 (+),score=50.19 TRINITY_DN1909_c1_g1_i1:78-542(+)